jgi:hypothetical protein
MGFPGLAAMRLRKITGDHIEANTLPMRYDLLRFKTQRCGRAAWLHDPGKLFRLFRQDQAA